MQKLKNGTEWTSTGITGEAHKVLMKISEELGVSHREAASMAILYFGDSHRYDELYAAVQQLRELREKYPTLYQSIS